jgi:hypothetical protein
MKNTLTHGTMLVFHREVATVSDFALHQHQQQQDRPLTGTAIAAISRSTLLPSNLQLQTYLHLVCKCIICHNHFTEPVSRPFIFFSAAGCSYVGRPGTWEVWPFYSTSIVNIDPCARLHANLRVGVAWTVVMAVTNQNLIGFAGFTTDDLDITSKRCAQCALFPICHALQNVLLRHT